MLAVKWVKVGKFCKDTGYTEKAVTRKRQEGVWLQGQHWKKAPDGNVMINLVAFNNWVEGG